MNPITNVKNQNFMNERELRLGYTGTLSSWHRQYKDSAWVYIGGLNYDLTEGDIICVFSQYGEVVNLNLVRDRKTGTSKGFAFLCYEDQRSTVLATDNFNGIKLAGRIIRVDHVENYKVPKDGTVDVDVGKTSKRKTDAVTDTDTVAEYVRKHGCGPEVMKQIKSLEQQQQKIEAEKVKREAVLLGRNASPPRSHNSAVNGRRHDKESRHSNGRFRSPIKNGSRDSSLSPPRRRRVLSPNPAIKLESPFFRHPMRSPHSRRSPNSDTYNRRSERR